MPEETTNEATTQEFTAADALAAITQETDETEESEVVTAEEDKPEDETEEAEETEDSQDIDNDEDEDNDLYDKLALDKSIADKLPEDVRTRYEQQVKGIAKKERQLEERESTIVKDEDAYQRYQSYAEAFSQPDQAWEAYAYLGEQLKKLHGEAQQESEATTDDDGYLYLDGKTFYSQTELELYKELKELKAAKSDPLLEEIRAEREAKKQDEALNNWAGTNSPRIIAKVAAKTAGWGVTKDQVIFVAKTDKAGLEADPVMAMKRAFPDEYADFKSQGKPKPKVRDMVDSSEAKGFKIPDNPSEYTAAHALMELTG